MMIIILLIYPVLCVFQTYSLNVLICENKCIKKVQEGQLILSESRPPNRYLIVYHHI